MHHTLCSMPVPRRGFVFVLDTPSHHAHIFSFFDYEDENDHEDDWNKPEPRICNSPLQFNQSEIPNCKTRNSQPYNALINRTISSTASRMPVIRAREIML